MIDRYSGKIPGLAILALVLCASPLGAQTPWLTRSFDSSRTGSNTHEKELTPRKVGSNLMLKLFSLEFDDDPRLEAQPLYVPGLTMSDGKLHDVIYVCTMANNVWSFDANDGKKIWDKPASLGPPVKPKATTGKPLVDPQASPCRKFPQIATEIDMWGVNILWGILSTPVIDPDGKVLYVVNWTSPDGTVANAVYQLHAVNLVDGSEPHPPITIEAKADVPPSPGRQPATFVPSRQKQRAALLLATPNAADGTPGRKTLFIAFAMTHEEHDDTHGWLIAYDVATFRKTAAWTTTPNGLGGGIWQAAQGPAADEDGAIYLMTGNYGVQDKQNNTLPPADGDLPDSMVKLVYTAPTDLTGTGKLEAVAWFTPFKDAVRNKNGDDNFQDYDLGSGGPVPIPGMDLVVGAGKDGVLYVLPKNTAAFGKGADFARLKKPPIFFTYFPGFGIDAATVQNLDRLFDGKTHHLHGSPAFWESPTLGPMLFVWGENDSLRAWTIGSSGQVTFLARGAEVASAAMAGKGGMPGGFPVITANGMTPNTGIVWATAPISDDANRFVVEGILRAYDATALDPVKNVDGTARLKLLWDSKHIPGNTFCLSKFCPPVVADGKVFVPTYDGRVDVYGLATTRRAGPTPTNADRVPD
jgi:outer membrane protein assembly factor BamB